MTRRGSGWHGERQAHSLCAKGVRVRHDKVNIISNPNTVDFVTLRSESPVSYAYFVLQNRLNNMGIELIFVNEDKNRVYFKVKDRASGRKSYIMDVTQDELIDDEYSLFSIVKEVRYDD